jgi:hypothetical protein
MGISRYDFTAAVVLVHVIRLARWSDEKIIPLPL